jgi:hypothetical protein
LVSQAERAGDRIVPLGRHLQPAAGAFHVASQEEVCINPPINEEHRHEYARISNSQR